MKEEGRRFEKKKKKVIWTKEGRLQDHFVEKRTTHLPGTRPLDMSTLEFIDSDSRKEQTEINNRCNFITHLH